MIARLIARPSGARRSCIVLVLAAAALGVASLSEPAARRLPRPLGAGLQRDRAERGDGRRGARERRSRSRSRPRSRACPTCGASARRRQLGVAQVTIEFEPDADYYRARQLVAERVAQAVAQLPARHRRAAALEPDRAPQRDLRVHARGGAGRGRPDDAARPRRVRGAEPPARGARRRRRRAARRLPAPVPGPARSRPHGGARRHARRGAARGRGARTRTPSGGFVVQGPMEWTVRAVGRVRTRRGPARHRGRGARRHAGPARRRRRRARGARGAARHRAPAARRGGELPHRQAVRRRHRRGGRGHPRARSPRSGAALPPGVELRVVYDQSELVGDGARRRRPRRARSGAVLVVARAVRVARRPARGAARDAHAAALDRARGLVLERARRRPQHDDARRPRDRGRPARRRRDHRRRERPAPPRARRAASRRGAGRARRGAARSAARSRSRPRSSSPCSCRCSR